METKPIPICGEHRMLKEWRPTTIEYSDEGISIQIPKVYAWVCPVDGGVLFMPNTVGELNGYGLGTT